MHKLQIKDRERYEMDLESNDLRSKDRRLSIVVCGLGFHEKCCCY